MSRARAVSVALVAVTNLLGAAAFVYPFFLAGTPRGGEGAAHAADAPILFALLGALMLAIAVAEVRAGVIDARRVALLGVLAGVNAALRLPGGLAGANLMFLLPIVCGYSFGPGFGFLLGSASMAVSAVLTGGAGPWLPFQMWGLGWIGSGAGLLRPLLRSRGAGVAVAGLAAYGWIAGIGFGVLTNLWFWPYLSGTSEAISWRAGIGVQEAVRRYWRFYVLTSLAWDSARAFGNAVLVVALSAPLLRMLERFRVRLQSAVHVRALAEPPAVVARQSAIGWRP